MVNALVYYKSQILETPEVPTLTLGDGDSLFNDIVLEAGINNLVLQVTEEQYTKLLSSALNGVYTTYPEDYLEVLYPLIKAGKLNLCEQIIDCIETTPELRQTIINTTQGLPDTPQSPNQYQQDVFEEVVGCDMNVMYGYCRALWTYINANNIDFLQQLSEATNLTESIDRLLRTIPGFEQLPISEVLQWLSALGDYNLEAYEASITTLIEDKIVCDLLCIAVNSDCHLTFEQVYEYLVGRFGGSSALNLGATFGELVTFMVTGVYPSDKIVYLWSVVQLGFAFIGTRFLDISSVTPYAIQARAGIPDDAWEEICDECLPENTYNVTFDELTTDIFTVTASVNPTWSVTNTYVIQSTGNGNPVPACFCAYGSPPSSSNEGFNTTVRVELTTISDLIDVSFEYYFDRAGSQNVVARAIVLLDDTEAVITTLSDSGDNGIRTTWTQFGGSVAGNNIKYIDITMSLNINGTLATPANTYAYIDNIRFTVV